MIALRGLQIAFLERLAMPGTIALVNVHVVHVDGHPYIGGGIGYLIVHMGIDQEIVGTGVAILDVIHTWLAHRREIELYIIIFIIRAPVADGT